MTNEKRAKPESLDFLLAGIAPVFIIGMIGSLVYFLITVAYQGSHTERLKWILGLYTLAAVLIARIAIEQSRHLAFAYMFALAAATLVVTPQFFVVSGAVAFLSFPILVLLLVMVAFLADRITFDCTSMNEQVQSTGVGLLQSLGLVKSERRKSSGQLSEAVATEEISADSTRKSSAKRKHNPGVWVLYFSLLALPLFGLGQMLIKNPVDRSWGFTYLFFYLLSSLCLLVMISLLSLRKYLRERGVPMETSFAIRWLAIGMTSVFIVLLALSLLPIPGQSLLSMDLPFRITSRDDLKANRWGWGREGAEGEGPQQGEGDAPNKPDGTQDGKGPGKDGKQPGDKQQEGQQKGDKPSGDTKQTGDAKQAGDAKQKEDGKKNSDGEAKADQKPAPNVPRNNGGEKPNPDQPNPDQPNPDQPNQDQQDKGEQDKPDKPDQDKPAKGQPEQEQRKGEQRKEEQPNRDQQQNAKQPPPENKPEGDQPPPPTPQSLSIQWDLSAAFQWLVMIVMAIAAIVYAIVYRRELLAAIKSFRDWLSALLGGQKKLPPPKIPSVEDPAVIAELYPPFHTFEDPFTSTGWTCEQVVRHLYRAMLSWGYEHRIVRREDETPEEFMRRLFRRFPEQQESFSTLGTLYNRIAYARGKVSRVELKPLVELWQWLLKKTP